MYICQNCYDKYIECYLYLMYNIEALIGEIELSIEQSGCADLLMELGRELE